jgi:hypothetical protein
MPEAPTSLATDLIKKLGDTALDAVLGAAGSAIWDHFFPSAPAMFSTQELNQLTTLFTGIFGEQQYGQYKDRFTSSSRSLTEYVNNPSASKLAILESNLQDEVVGIKSHGYATAQVYLAVAGQYLLSQRLDLDATEKENPSHVDGARKNIAAAALDTLSDLIDLEKGYGAAAGWGDYIAFKRSTVLDDGPLPQSAVNAFGADYPHQVQQLLRVVKEYDGASLAQVQHPAYMLMIAAFDPGQFPNTWVAYSNSYERNLWLYKSPAALQGIPTEYRPLGDVAWTQEMASQPAAPTQVVYVAPHTKELIDPTGWSQIYNDHGSGKPSDYAGFWSQQPDQTGGVTSGIGSWLATDDNATTPDDPSRCKLVDSAYYTPVELPRAAWDDTGTKSKEDGTVYMHPQFGDYGLHVIERSHSRPDPSTVPGLSYDVIAGHPELKDA